MTEEEILQRWAAEKPIYEAWADLIKGTICQELSEAITPVSLDYFFKVPVQCRLKADSTLVDKALVRKKYDDPYDDITDKVGMRFVVLLTTDISKICEVIEGERGQLIWEASKDRDYERERLEKPLEFSYQSVHYVLRAKNGVKHMELEIPLGISCEVQVRTLLQHAHSELTHDTIYKPKTTARPEIRRTVAKSMALIEATDEFFEQAMKNLDEAANKQRQLMGVLAELYETGVGASPGFERSNQILIDCFMEGLPPPPFSEIRQYLDSKAFIFDRVKERLGNRHFFGQLSVLLAYYLVDTAPAVTQQNWPLDVDDLATVFSDLGKKYAS